MKRFENAIIQELEVSENIIQKGKDVTLRFRILSNDGDYTIHTSMTGHYKRHMKMLCMVKYFMIWKDAKAFVMSSSLTRPNIISSAGINAKIALAAYETVTINPLKFSSVHWLENSELDPVFENILPQPADNLAKAQEQECLKIFGAKGKFKVNRILH